MLAMLLENAMENTGVYKIVRGKVEDFMLLSHMLQKQIPLRLRSIENPTQ